MPRILFKNLLRDWFDRYLLPGNKAYAAQCWRRLEKTVLPALGDREPKKITPPMILALLRPIELSGRLVTARKIKSHISQAMRYGIACGLVASDPTRDIGFALAPCRSRPRASIAEPREIGLLLKKIQDIRFRKRRLSLLLAVLTFVRPGELVKAEWGEIAWEQALWRIPAEKMKMKRPHLVPLARQTLELLRELQRLTGSGQWLFPSGKNPGQHEWAGVLTSGLRSIGYPPHVICAHGFRAMAATVLADLGFASEAIERQLAHADKNRVRAAYQRSELLEQRRAMMQAWADWLDLRHAWAVLGRK